VITRVTLTTANTPGAVAIVHLQGDQVGDVLGKLAGRERWTNRHAYLVSFADIDEGLAIRVSATSAQLMPHGGPRVVQRLLEHLTQQLGCTYEPEPDPQAIYPEAASPIEADMLDAIAKAASPAAIDLLAKQPRLWRGLLQQAGEVSDQQRQHIATRSQTLNHLLTPPTVVVAGPANVGKSTLTNALMGKAMSIVADLPGTTRDWVGGLVELSATNNAQQAIAVNWLDTPGLRDSDDTIEQRAIQLAKQQIEQADVLIAMRDPDQPWPDADSLPRTPDLYLVNKADDAHAPQAGAGLTPEHPLSISASHGINLDPLQSQVIGRLGLDGLQSEPWAFTKKLLVWCDAGEQQFLNDYLNQA
jgi:tRNA modification GTPase